MSKSRHTEAQMIGALKQLEAGRKVEDVAREVGVSKHTIYAWKAKYGGMDVSEAQEAKQLRDENTKVDDGTAWELTGSHSAARFGQNSNRDKMPQSRQTSSQRAVAPASSSASMHCRNLSRLHFVNACEYLAARSRQN